MSKKANKAPDLPLATISQKQMLLMDLNQMHDLQSVLFFSF
jgi:hypothetical protein